MAERWEDAKLLIDRLRLEFPDSIDALGRTGTIAAQLEDREEAHRISRELEANDTPYVFGLPTVWRARIAALLGDKQGAADLLVQSYREGAPYGLALLHDMDLESLRGFPAFDRFIAPRG